MESSLESFSEGRDPRVLFAVEQVLRVVQLEERLPTLFSENPSRPRSMAVDSLATEIVRGSLLYSLGPYDIGLTLLNTRGVPIGGYFETEQVLSRGEQVQADSILFDILHAMYGEQDSTGSLIEQITGRIERDRFQYVGLAPIGSMDNRSGWVMVRVEPQVLMSFSETPFPRVLLPSAFAGNLQSNLSLAEFRNGVLIRSLGRDFGRYRLSAAVSSTLLTKNDLWLDETIEGNDYLSFYRRHQPATPSYIQAPVLSSINPGVVGVRLPALNLFDHLYYLLRMVTAGLFFGVPAFLLGLWFRKRAGLIPARRIRFRDKVLNSFLGVGIVSMLAFGMVGSQVITGETENTISSWLRQHLERVEETLVLQARMDEMPYQVLARSQIDSLSSQVGLELNVYEGYHLVKSSRPQLVRDRLIDTRLPIEAYEALFFGDSRFVVSEGRMGTFAYKTGYRALLDEEGRPRYVLSVPTLPQQERIEEEQARTLAYLFGALLLLVLAVMLTASLVANALARPIARLRAGLEAVAMGNFERTIPVETRDEIGELVETFNSMQHQLAESRRILAQQERQLAWREMARQIAHEIKNPLTPMKLSVQHLRRAFDGLSISQAGQNDAAGNRFTGLFERITTTLVEQIDALARIANEFHSFARLPSRVLEQVDMNRVVQEAVALMQDDALIDIELATSDTPLIIEADREELRRIFINLIKNAIEAIPAHKDGRIWVRTLVDVSEDTGRAWAVSEVSDNGGGIPAELTDKIFQPNFSTKTSGTGLGLAISRKSVEDFGGEINFVTMEHEGTTFTIRIPLAVAAAGKG